MNITDKRNSIMDDKIIVIVFDNEKKACQGLTALRELHHAWKLTREDLVELAGCCTRVERCIHI